MLCLGSEAALTLSFLNRTDCKTNEKAVFRIRIRDPVPFRPQYPGSRMKKNPDPGMNIPDHFSESFETVFWVKNA
jgi:hypothetical protein